MPASAYVTEQGAVIRREGRRFLVTKGEETLFELPAWRVERVLIFGAVQVTTQAMAFFLDEGVDLVFFSSNGRYRGQLVGPMSANVYLRLAQYGRLNQDAARLSFGRAVVTAKLANARALLLRYQRNHPGVAFSEELEELDRCICGAQRAASLQELTGVEGQGTAAYFRAYGRMLTRDFRFERRTRRPPRDPVNAALSLGYALLTAEIVGALYHVGLDPYVGLYHQPHYGRPSLALDLCEEFRHPVVDMLVLEVLNRGILAGEDFTEDADGEGVRLSQDGLKAFLAQYERRVTKEFRDRETGQLLTIRALIRRQARALASFVLGRTDYHPFRIR